MSVLQYKLRQILVPNLYLFISKSVLISNIACLIFDFLNN